MQGPEAKSTLLRVRTPALRGLEIDGEERDPFGPACQRMNADILKWFRLATVTAKKVKSVSVRFWNQDTAVAHVHTKETLHDVFVHGERGVTCLNRLMQINLLFCHGRGEEESKDSKGDGESFHAQIL